MNTGEALDGEKLKSVLDTAMVLHGAWKNKNNNNKNNCKNNAVLVKYANCCKLLRIYFV